MFLIVQNAWALLLGMFLLMVGNGLQGTLLGVRGGIEGFDAATMAWVMSAFFAGFLGGSRAAPWLIRRVGHVRVFAALGSLISAAFILYATIPDPWVWAVMRLVVGFCFAGVYVVAESWLNNSATNETRGKALSAYLIVQMLGIVLAQALLMLADPGGFILFAVMSVLVSISFAPILLSVSPAPVFETTKRMTLVQLYRVSPLGCVSVFVLGAVFSLLFGMAPVYATEVGLSLGQISIFIGTIYVGGLLAQYPIGWVSDRMDRRRLIVGLTAVATITIALGMAFVNVFAVLLVLAFVIGGVANPLYSLLIAYTNDFLESDDMAAASSGLIFLNGMGAIGAPLALGWAMSRFGAWTFFAALFLLFGFITLYGLYRMTQRPSTAVADQSAYAPVLPQASPVAVAVAQEYAIEMAEAASATETQRHDASDDTTKPDVKLS